MSKNINTTVSAAFTKFIKADDKARAMRDEARTALVTTLATAGVLTRDQAYPLATEWASTTYNCPLKDGEGKAKDTQVLDKDHAEYEAARKQRTRVLAVFETAEAASVQKTETVTPATEAQKALFVAFMAASANKANGKAVFDALFKQFKG